MIIDIRLKEFATLRETEYIDALIEHGTFRKAGRALGVNKSSILKSINRLKVRAAARGYAPEADMTRVVPDPFVVRGTSTLYDKTGMVAQQWVKTRLDDHKLGLAIRAAVDALADDVVRVKATPGPLSAPELLLNLITMTDCHIGMRSWKPETGEDWDLEIAERQLCASFEHLIYSMPPAKYAFVNQLGDFLHYDGLLPITPTHGFVLDADGRFQKVIAVATRVLRYVVKLALARHEVVHLVIKEGNHDMASSAWLRHLFTLLFENEPRVIVVDSPSPYFAHQHGQTMLAFHHGHLSKMERLPGLFAADFSKMWGDTKYRYCHVGHLHHTHEKEDGGMNVIQHPTMAARDAHASRHGWSANRLITGITYHAIYGQVARNTVVPEMIQP